MSTLGAFVLLALVWFGKDLFQSTARMIGCDDGPRQTIDLRDFVTQYSAYSVEFQTVLAEKARFSGKLEPILLQQLSDALQQANEFRKFLVAGYNACAVTKAQYAHFGAGFQAMDGVARQIDSLAQQPALTAADRVRLTDLVAQYVALAQKAIHE